MKKYLKKLLSSLIHPLAIRLGYQKRNVIGVDAHHKNNLLFNFYTTLIKVGFVPKHIVDVGANHGTWTREALKYFPDAYYTLLEPQAWMKVSINDLIAPNKKINFYGIGAGEKRVRSNLP